MEHCIELEAGNIEQIAKRISSPTFNRDEITTGIVHFGVGGFHRAHLAYYMHQLHEKGGHAKWGITGVGIREGDRKMYDILDRQDGLYTLIIRHPNGQEEHQVIGSIQQMLLGVDDPQNVLNVMANPATKIVSLTITEGGYNFNPITGAFIEENADVQHDLRFPTKPKTIFGYLVTALKMRRDKGLPAFTILSCDNMEHNGNVTRDMVLAYATLLDKEMAEWIEKEVSFPNSMVDRITPVTTTEDINELKDKFNIIDRWPVTCEPFIQWIVEDEFPLGRPNFESIGVQFVSDVTPYEKMKLRMLNAGHTVLGILGALHGYKTIDACVEDDTFRAYLKAFLDIEATPVLDEVKGIDLDIYKESLVARFANPNIKDSVTRICSESSAKLPKFLIPTIHENLSNNESIKLGTLIIAAWCYYSDKNVNQENQPIEIIDINRSELKQAAQRTKADPLAFLRQEEIFGELHSQPRFTELYIKLIDMLYNATSVKDCMRLLLSDQLK